MTNGKTCLLCSLATLLILSLESFLPHEVASEPAFQMGLSSGPPPGKTDDDNSGENDYARFLAGMPTSGSALGAFEKDPGWISYVASINRSWENFEARQLRPMRQWVSQELCAAGTATAIYPFSGPDFLNLYTLFPHAKTYILVALEPVGVLPDFSTVDLPDYFADLQRCLWQYLYTDFFVTSRMAAQIADTELRGVLPILLFFMAREHARVLDVRYLAMKPDGTLEERQALNEGDPGPGIQGVRLVFAAADSPEERTLYYFCFNLQNGSWERNPQFASFLKSFGPLTTFTKSASYLLFSRYTSDLKQFILDRSQYLLQDDSGIPLKDFDPVIWNLKFYGTYIGPINLFSSRYQPDLAKVYNTGKDVYPLPFGIGYQFRPGTSNLIFASKKQEYYRDDRRESNETFSGHLACRLDGRRSGGKNRQGGICTITPIEHGEPALAAAVATQ